METNLKSMKKLTNIFLFLLITTAATAQKKDLINDVYYSPGKKVELTAQVSQLQAPAVELAWLKTNLANYHRERKTAFILQITGAVASSASVFIKDEELQKVTAGAGLALSLTGSITLFSAERHLKLAAGPVPK